MIQKNDVANGLHDRLKHNFKDPEARHIYAEELTNTLLSEQMKRLREDRKLSQEDLAKLMGTKQSGISRLQARNYSSWKVETLRKLARAFGVRLRISFAEFGTIFDDLNDSTDSTLSPRKFEDDPAFKNPPSCEELAAPPHTASNALGSVVARMPNRNQGAIQSGASMRGALGLAHHG